MRVGIYDAFWKTMGGGEKLAASYAEALQDDYDVTLLAHEEVSLDDLAGHLDLDLHNVAVEVIPTSAGAVSEASAAFDIFINCSFLGSYPARAKRSFFIAMFPDRPAVEPTPVRDQLFELRDVVLPQVARIDEGPGFYPAESDGVSTWRWTGPAVTFEGHPVSAEPFSVLLTVDGSHRPLQSSAEFLVEINGVTHRRFLDRTGPRTFVFLATPTPGQNVEIRLTVEPFTVDGDSRSLGVQVSGIDVHRPAYEAVAEEILALNHTHHVRKWMDSYESIVSISEFTRAWVRNYWGRESVVLHPSVRPRVPVAKQPVVLSIGRFSEHAEHSKKQLELVNAFRLLLERPESAGWELWLMGGTVEAAYVVMVRKAADGLPVKIYENASGEQVSAALASASIYWHGMGLGENPHQDPVKFEHFGISIVEAMSAGAVPLVVEAGGQAEIVEDGINGLLYGAFEELVEQTALLLRHPALRDQLSTAAICRAGAFSPERFRQGVRQLLRPTA